MHCLHVRELNTYDVLNSDVVVFTSDTLPTSGSGSGGHEESPGGVGDVDGAPNDGGGEDEGDGHDGTGRGPGEEGGDSGA